MIYINYAYIMRDVNLLPMDIVEATLYIQGLVDEDYPIDSPITGNMLLGKYND